MKKLIAEVTTKTQGRIRVEKLVETHGDFELTVNGVEPCGMRGLNDIGVIRVLARYLFDADQKIEFCGFIQYHSGPVFEKLTDCIACAVVSRLDDKGNEQFDNAHYLYDLIDRSVAENEIENQKFAVVDAFELDGVICHKIQVGDKQFWTFAAMNECGELILPDEDDDSPLPLL